MDLVDTLMTEISTVLLRCEGAKIHLSSSKSIEMLEMIEEIYLFWSSCSTSIQEAFNELLASNHPQHLQVLHKFLFKTMRGNYSLLMDSNNYL